MFPAKRERSAWSLEDAKRSSVRQVTVVSPGDEISPPPIVHEKSRIPVEAMDSVGSSTQIRSAGVKRSS
jgi:hypothetical protein